MENLLAKVKMSMENFLQLMNEWNLHLKAEKAHRNLLQLFNEL